MILITKSEEETLMEEAIGKRITDYLIKPVNPSQVFLACKRVFDAQKLQDSQRARDYVGEMQRWQMLDRRRLDWQGWVDLAVEVARWDVGLDGAPEAGLQQAHADFRRGLNIDFARLIEDHYPALGAARGEGRPTAGRCSRATSCAHAVVPHLKAGKRVVFIVIDCMRLDQWFTLEPLLEDWFDDPARVLLLDPAHRHAVLAQLDLRRPAARRTAAEAPGPVAGEQPRRAHAQPLRAPVARLPARAPRRDAGDGAQVHQDLRRGRGASTRGGRSTRSPACRWSRMVFNFLDILAHGRSESDILQELAPDEAAFRAVMKAWFTHSPLYEIFQALVDAGLRRWW